MDLEKRIRMAAESILENESIRSGMDEEGANLLLDWGTTCAKQIAATTAEIEDDFDAEDAVYSQMKALRGMLGAIQQLFSPETDAARQPELWSEITAHAPVVYGREAPGLADIQQGLLTSFQSLGNGERIRMLRALIENQLS